MKRVFAILVASSLVLGTAAAVAADAPGKPPTAAQWAALAKLPDWSGIWEVDWRGQRRAAAPAGATAAGGPPRFAMRPQPKLKPKYQAMAAAYRAARAKGENIQGESANCVPPGLPGIMSQPYPIEFLYSPGKVVILIEAYMQFRHIYTDGRKHQDDPDPTFMGDSIGHWEGDTLVVDSVGFNDVVQIAPGVPHSDKLHIIERIHKVDPEWMEIQTTLDDPEVLEEPFTTTASYHHLNDRIREYICVENNHDSTDDKGRPGFSTEDEQ